MQKYKIRSLYKCIFISKWWIKPEKYKKQDWLS